ncbi:outer membrane beta-barrel protein [Chitinophagaceae bacterium LWZ2-11]
MKRLACITVALTAALTGFAQKDSTAKENVPDTIKVGNFVIIKQNKGGNKNDENWNRNATVNVFFDRKNTKRKPSNISTNWIIFDLGFANYRDQTNYTAAQSMGYLRQIGPGGPVTQSAMTLNTGKSSNVNIWLFMQKFNVYKHIFNLKYGLGLEMYNFRYDRSISYRNNPQPFVFMDSIGFSKDKLYTGYLTVPFMLNINPSPERRHGFNFSVGASAGYLVGSHAKQISSERGKQKISGGFDLNPWRFALVSEIGLGPVRVYGSYSLNALHRDFTGLEQYPFAVGIRFSNW